MKKNDIVTLTLDDGRPGGSLGTVYCTLETCEWFLGASCMHEPSALLSCWAKPDVCFHDAVSSRGRNTVSSLIAL